MGSRFKKPERLGSVVESVLADLGLFSAYRNYKIMNKWADAVGPIVAKVTEPDRIEHGTLFVKVTNSSWRQELHYYKAEIIVKLNDGQDYDVVKDIILV
ncbi:DUF721 domain-containing protein [candidate division KSB1 bacterium]